MIKSRYRRLLEYFDTNTKIFHSEIPDMAPWAAGSHWPRTVQGLGSTPAKPPSMLCRDHLALKVVGSQDQWAFATSSEP